MKSLRSPLFSKSAINLRDEICRLPLVARGSHKVSAGNSKIVSSKLLVRKLKKPWSKFPKISTHSIGRKQDSGDIPKSYLLITGFPNVDKGQKELEDYESEPKLELTPTYVFPNFSLPTFSHLENTFNTLMHESDDAEVKVDPMKIIKNQDLNANDVIIVTRNEEVSNPCRNLLLDVIENPKDELNLNRLESVKSEDELFFDAEDEFLGMTPSDSIWKTKKVLASKTAPSHQNPITTTFVQPRSENGLKSFINEEDVKKIREENLSLLDIPASENTKRLYKYQDYKETKPNILNIPSSDKPPEKQVKEEKIDSLTKYIKDKLDNLFLMSNNDHFEDCLSTNYNDLALNGHEEVNNSSPFVSLNTKKPQDNDSEDPKKSEKPSSDPSSILSIINSVDKSAVIVQKDLYITNKILDSIKKKEKDTKIEALSGLFKDTNFADVKSEGKTLLNSAPKNVMQSRQTHDSSKKPEEPKLNVNMATKTIISSTSKDSGSEISVVEIQKFTDKRLPFPFSTETVLQVFGTREKLKDGLGVIEKSKAKLAVMNEPQKSVEPTFQNMLSTLNNINNKKVPEVPILIPIRDKQEETPSREAILRQAKHAELVKLAQSITANNKAMRITITDKPKRFVIRRNKSKIKTNLPENEERKPFKESVEEVKILGPKEIDLILGLSPKDRLQNRATTQQPISQNNIKDNPKEAQPTQNDDKPFFNQHLPNPIVDVKTMSNNVQMFKKPDQNVTLKQDDEGLSLRDKAILKNIILGKYTTTRDFGHKKTKEEAPVSPKKSSGGKGNGDKPTDGDDISKQLIEQMKRDRSDPLFFKGTSMRDYKLKGEEITKQEPVKPDDKDLDKEPIKPLDVHEPKITVIERYKKTEEPVKPLEHKEPKVTVIEHYKHKAHHKGANELKPNEKKEPEDLENVKVSVVIPDKNGVQPNEVQSIPRVVFVKQAAKEAPEHIDHEMEAIKPAEKQEAEKFKTAEVARPNTAPHKVSETSKPAEPQKAPTYEKRETSKKTLDVTSPFTIDEIKKRALQKTQSSFNMNVKNREQNGNKKPIVDKIKAKVEPPPKPQFSYTLKKKEENLEAVNKRPNPNIKKKEESLEAFKQQIIHEMIDFKKDEPAPQMTKLNVEKPKENFEAENRKQIAEEKPKEEQQNSLNYLNVQKVEVNIEDVNKKPEKNDIKPKDEASHKPPQTTYNVKKQNENYVKEQIAEDIIKPKEEPPYKPKQIYSLNVKKQNENHAVNKEQEEKTKPREEPNKPKTFYSLNVKKQSGPNSEAANKKPDKINKPKEEPVYHKPQSFHDLIIKKRESNLEALNKKQTAEKTEIKAKEEPASEKPQNVNIKIRDENHEANNKEMAEATDIKPKEEPSQKPQSSKLNVKITETNLEALNKKPIPPERIDFKKDEPIVNPNVFDPYTPASNHISQFLFNFDKFSKEMTPILDKSLCTGCSIPEDKILEFPMINPNRAKYEPTKNTIISMDVEHNLMLKKQLKGIPSVTAVLNSTMSDSSKAALSRWRTTMINQLGVEGFRDFYKEQLKKGSDFHGSVHKYLKTSKNARMDNVSNLTFKSVKEVLKNVTDVSVLESQVVHSQLGYRGVVDCVAKYKGVPVVIEWKRSDKPKPTVRHTFDAPLQLCAYLGALNYDKTYNLQVQGAVVVVAYSDGTKADVYSVSLDECAMYWKQWLSRYKTYVLNNNGFPLSPLT